MKKHSLPTILFGDSIIPRYIPFHHRLFLLWCKLSRSARRRFLSLFLKRGPIPEEENIEPGKTIKLGEGRAPLVNKTFSNLDDDLNREEMREVAREIDGLKEVLKAKGLKFTTTAGNFKEKDFIPEKERYKLWENTWMLAHSGVRRGDVVLDIGGASSIFSFLLAHMGCETHVVDNDWGNHGIVYNARLVNARMGWGMELHRRDISKKVPFKDSFFDKVFCICVLEHLPPVVRRAVMREIKRVLKPGGTTGLTFDYDAGRIAPGLDKGIRYSFKRRLLNDIIEPSGLEIHGNTELTDDCPPKFFLGSLFLTKPM